ncbi:MAG: hypothetical protein LBR81_08085 [Prevotellaceae bacterium]|jgi:hypothetical protein|nr:hypothetical protein [Prevotellaceae bacterium]
MKRKNAILLLTFTLCTQFIYSQSDSRGDLSIYVSNGNITVSNSGSENIEYSFTYKVSRYDKDGNVLDSYERTKSGCIKGNKTQPFVVTAPEAPYGSGQKNKFTDIAITKASTTNQTCW